MARRRVQVGAVVARSPLLSASGAGGRRPAGGSRDCDGACHEGRCLETSPAAAAASIAPNGGRRIKRRAPGPVVGRIVPPLRAASEHPHSRSGGDAAPLIELVSACLARRPTRAPTTPYRANSSARPDLRCRRGPRLAPSGRIRGVRVGGTTGNDPPLGRRRHRVPGAHRLGNRRAGRPVPCPPTPTNAATGPTGRGGAGLPSFARQRWASPPLESGRRHGLRACW